MDHQSDVQKQPLQEQHQRLSESQNIVYIHQEPQGYKNHNYSYQHDRTHLTGDQHFQSHNANFEHFENQYPFVTNGNFSPSNTSTTLIPNSLDLGKSKNYQTGVTNSGYSSENGSVSTNRHQKTDATMQFTSGNFQNLDLQNINYQQASPYFLQNLGNQYQLNENLVPTYQSSGSSPSSDESSVSNASQLQYSSDSSTISNNQFEFPVPISNTAQIGQNFQFQQKDFLDNYMAVMHQDTQVPRCDSSKSEAEESTCSSLSSGSNESQSENENVLHLPVLVNPLTSNNGNCNIINPYQSNVQNTASTYPNSLEQNETNEITNNYTNQAGQNVLKYNNFNTTISNQQYLANENNSGINNGMPPNNQVNNLVVMLPNHLNKDIQNCLQTGQPILQNPSSQEMVNSSKFVIQNPKVNSQNIFGLINVTTPVIQDKLVTPVKVNQMIKVNNCGTHESCHRNEHNSDAGNKTNNSNCGLCNEGNNKKFGVAPNCDEDTHLHSSNHHSNGEVTDTCTSHIQNTSDSSVIDSNFVQTNLSVKCRENENSCAMLFKETSDKSITQSVGNVNSSVFDSNSVYLVKGDESNVINSYCYGDSSTKSCSSGNSGMQTFPVPTGWNRLLVDGSIIYLSPSNVALNSIEQIKMYLQTAGTCKCGLECPVNCDSMFNFNPKVISRPWDASESEKTRLCNHKRKASLSGISAAGDDKNVKLSRKKVIPTKRKKKKNGSNCSGASVSQLLAQRDRALAAAAAAEATHWSSRPPENAGFANPMNNQFQNIQLMKNQAHLQQKTFDTNSQGAHVMKLETPPARLADDKVAQFPCMNVINNSVREGAVLNVNGVSQLLPENNASGNELMRASQLNTTELPNQSQDIGQGMINHCAAAHPCGQEFVQNAVATPKPEGVMLNPQGMLYPPNVVMQRPRSIPPWHQAKMGINKKAVPEAPVVYEKVPFIQQSMPPPTATYEEVASRKKVKSISKGKKTSQEPSQPSFMENPSAYLAQQTALLHNTISRPNFNILADTRSATELPQNQQYPLSTSLGVAPCVVDNSSSLNVSSSMTIPSQRTSNLPVRPVVGHKIDQTNISQLQIGRRSVSEKETLITSGLNTGKDNFGDVTFNNHTCSNKNCADCKNSPLLATGVQNNIATSGQVRSDLKFIPKNVPKYQILGKGDWMGPEPGELVKAPISRNYDESNSNEDNPVTSSTENVPAAYNQKIISDLRPIQGGTISTSNGSPQPQPSPNSSNVFRQEISSPKQQELASQSPVTGNIQISSSNSYAGLSNGVGTRMGQEYDGIALRTFAMNSRSKREDTPSNQGLQSFANNGKTLFPEGDQRTKFVSHNVTVTTSSDQTSELNSECKGDQMKIQSVTSSLDERGEKQHNTCETKANRFVNTMATGHTNSSNTITSVQAGKTQTATVSVSNNSTGPPNALSLFNTFNQNLVNVQTAQKGNAKSPLEMVHNVVSNIQTTAEVAKNDVPLNAIPINKNVLTNSTSLSNVLTSTTNVNTTILANNNTNTTAMLKSSSGTLQAGHILVSSNGQYLVASNGNVLPQTNLSGLKLNQTPSMPPISAAPVITSNVTGAVTQVLPAVGVAQQVLGQSTVLVNALPTPFVIQPGVMAVETGLGRLAVATGNILQGNVIDNNALRNSIRGVVPTEKVKYKKGNKKRKNQVTSLVQMASPNNVILNQSFSPQNFTVSPGGNVQPLQAVTLVQGKHGQLVMNNQSNFNQFNNQPQQINLLQPVNLTSVPNFPAFQQFIVPGLGNMVMSADGTATILPDTNIGVQLQLQNVNGQNVLTPVQNTSFINSPGILTTPTGMFIRAPNNQQKIIQNNASPQFLSPNNNQFLVNQFQGQLSPLIAANLSPNQQLFASSPPRQSPQEFIQIIPTSSSQNTTVVQQNTTIVQQQTTMVSNNQNILNNSGKSNFILSNQSGEKPIEVQIVGGTHRQSQSSQPTVTTPIQQVNRSVAQEKVDFGTQHSVSTQTNVGEESVTNVGVATNNTFCQTLHSNWSGSPPDTTTHSPVELESNYERPHTPTEEGPDSLRQAMVQYVSSSINESENESDAYLISGSGKVVAPKENVSRTNKTKNFVESSTITQETGVQIQIGNSYMSGDYLKSTVDECVVSSHLDVSVQDKHIESQSNITRYQDDKISLVDALLAENKSGHLEEGAADSKEKLTKGDLVWGPVRGSPAWPGKLVGPVSPGGKALVRWFGGHSSPTKVNVSQLQSLSQGLEAHHRAFNKGRKNRRLNAALEAAIQEAMLELDKITAREKKIPGSGRGRPRRMHR